ncbi:MAG: hypothetical protein ACREMK_03050 [Gemmatimonadota bacterium]
MPIAVAVGVLAAACDVSTSEPFVRRTFEFTFENNIGEWMADATDVDDPPVTWSVERSNELAERGEWSVRLSLDNLNDAGKIWMEREFQLAPGITYGIEVSFDFASADFGNVNLWRIIAGATAVDPETADDLTFQDDDTGNGADEDVGHVWTARRYELGAVTADPEGSIWVALGVWGTFETARTYYVDDVELIFTRQ